VLCSNGHQARRCDNATNLDLKGVGCKVVVRVVSALVRGCSLLLAVCAALLISKGAVEGHPKLDLTTGQYSLHAASVEDYPIGFAWHGSRRLADGTFFAQQWERGTLVFGFDINMKLVRYRVASSEER
jgi:hypothetical protein